MAEHKSSILNNINGIKGLEIQRLIGLAVAGFIYARTITKASDKG